MDLKAAFRIQDWQYGKYINDTEMWPSSKVSKLYEYLNVDLDLNYPNYSQNLIKYTRYTIQSIKVNTE